MARCSICHTQVAAAEETSACPACQQVYHRECWDEIGGCATYGCSKAAEAQKPAPDTRAGGGWGDDKACPSCSRVLASSLLRCPCGAQFPWADPMSAEEYREWRGAQLRVGHAKSMLLLLFFVSLLGITAPVTGLIGGLYARARRRLLEGEHGTYLALGYGSAALGATYALVLLAVAAGL